jgi:hypothetical protein
MLWFQQIQLYIASVPREDSGMAKRETPPDTSMPVTEVSTHEPWGGSAADAQPAVGPSFISDLPFRSRALHSR